MYRRVRSLSCSSLPLWLPSTTTTAPHSTPAYTLRQMHGSILHPRAPKIRHLNASHTLLMDMEIHIQKVQVIIWNFYFYFWGRGVSYVRTDTGWLSKN
jgi:hypothetical protein